MGIPATSASSERAFSLAGRVMTCSRTGLSSGTMKRLLYTKMNWKRIVVDKWTYLESEEEAAAAAAAAATSDTDADSEEDEFDEDGVDYDVMEAEYRFDRMELNEGFSDTFMG